MSYFRKLYIILFVAIILVVVKCRERGRTSSEVSRFPTGIGEREKEWAATANTLYDRGSYLESIPIWDSLIRTDSLNGEYYYKRAFSSGQAGFSENAILGFKKSAMLNFKKASSYYNIGVNNLFVDDSTAIIYFRKTLEIDSSHTKARILIGECIERISRRRINDGPLRKR